jgi:hypothetical protein
MSNNPPDYLHNPFTLDSHNAVRAQAGLPPVDALPAGLPVMNAPHPDGRIRVQPPVFVAPAASMAPPTPAATLRNPFAPQIEAAAVAPNVPAPAAPAPAQTWLDAARARGPLK